MWQKKKVRLVYRVGRRHVKFRARNVSRCRQIDLPNGLFVEPMFGNIFGHFGDFCQFFYRRDALPVPLGAVVDFGEFGIHYLNDKKSSKETKSRVCNRERAAADKKKLPLFLQLAWLVHVREIRRFGQSQSLVGVGLVVELERVIGVCEVFLRVFFDFFVGVDPVEQLCSLA